MICSLGKHTGGELWQWPGDVLDIHDNFKLSDGLLPHATLPFEGERYNLVYYCVKELRAPPCDEDAKLLNDLGFWPMEARPLANKAGKARLDLLKPAAAKLNDFLMNYLRDPSNDTSGASNDATDGSHTPASGRGCTDAPPGMPGSAR